MLPSSSSKRIMERDDVAVVAISTTRETRTTDALGRLVEEDKGDEEEIIVEYRLIQQQQQQAVVVGLLADDGAVLLDDTTAISCWFPATTTTTAAASASCNATATATASASSSCSTSTTTAGGSSGRRRRRRSAGSCTRRFGRRRCCSHNSMAAGPGILLLLALSLFFAGLALVSAVSSHYHSSLSLSTTDYSNSIIDGGQAVYKYNICNGLSNQLLYHAASIAIAIEQGKAIEIPNHFIVNGVQHTDDAVLPSATNSIPFKHVFDAASFLNEIYDLGLRKATFVTFDFSNGQRQIPCAGMQSLHQANPILVKQILSNAFNKPSSKLERIIGTITNSLNNKGMDDGDGVCVHHRDGQDWYDHCARWSSIDDGIYRGNCLGVPGRSFVESLEDRGLIVPGGGATNSYDNDSNKRWIYYCGDHEIPRQLSSDAITPYDVVSRDQIMDYSTKSSVVSLASDNGRRNSNKNNIRDLWALIDFYVCRDVPNFIGNSVSTFSAIQIAIRQSERAYWYNTQSIPLGDIWRSYTIPIVYTYTELSKPEGKHLLQASIVSVKTHMPATKIHILYHGKKDKAFRLWLARKGVILHQHDPVWRSQIEQMRRNGDAQRSHLFLHSGNYFGTWQRIDIPLFVESEYVLLLDSDTIVLKPFTLADFGLDMTYGIAMSSEMTPDSRPSNAGVMLMNIPKMRQTYDEFLDFVLSHVSNGAKFNHPSPSDQGAYCEFYEKENLIKFLPRQFNFKPYWKYSDIDVDDPFIVHFHGAKPHDYLKQIMGDTCDKALKGLCDKAMRLPFLCRSIQHFAMATRSNDQVAYCNSSFKFDKAKALFCNEIMAVLAMQDPNTYECIDFPDLVRQALHRLPMELDLPRAKIERNLRKGAYVFYPPVFLVWMAALVFVGRWYYVKSSKSNNNNNPSNSNKLLHQQQLHQNGCGGFLMKAMATNNKKEGRHNR